MLLFGRTYFALCKDTPPFYRADVSRQANWSKRWHRTTHLHAPPLFRLSSLTRLRSPVVHRRKRNDTDHYAHSVRDTRNHCLENETKTKKQTARNEMKGPALKTAPKEGKSDRMCFLEAHKARGHCVRDRERETKFRNAICQKTTVEALFPLAARYAISCPAFSAPLCAVRSL